MQGGYQLEFQVFGHAAALLRRAASIFVRLNVFVDSSLSHQFALTLNPSKCTVAPPGGAALLKYVAVRVRLWPGNKVM
jgi:hypothetical protein